MWYKVYALDYKVRTALAVAAGLLVVAAAGAALLALLTFGRPPQPLPLGAVQWLGEAGVTVDRVERRRWIGSGAARLRARGEFYIVYARAIAPFGLRPTWHDSDAEVRTFAGAGGTLPPQRFGVDERAQALLDRQTGRPGPVHLIRGAEQHETLVFDLPVNVEQPAIIFLPANDPAGLLELLFGRFWQPHRFNLRYD